MDVAPPMLLQVLPPSVETCHWTVGAGVPEAAALNVTVVPETTLWPPGCDVTEGGVDTVNTAAAEVAEPAEFVNTARYVLPLSPWVTLNE